MSNIKFVSHDQFPEDQYTKEAIYLEVNVPMRILFVRKSSKNGGMFWSTPSVAVTKDGDKSYLESFMQDSSFLDKDIKKFLDERSWEKKGAKPAFKDEEIPF